jgi:hypothetical protein
MGATVVSSRRRFAVLICDHVATRIGQLCPIGPLRIRVRVLISGKAFAHMNMDENKYVQ